MQLKMYRPETLALPEIVVPEGFTIREMRPGEEACWSYCCMGEFGVDTLSEEAYLRKMASDSSVEMRNVFYACRNDEPVGTATAKCSEEGHPYLHYIAVNESARGHRLAYALIATVLHRHAENGRLGCFLTTDDFRVPAVKSYINMGYLPVLWTDDARERWEKMLRIYGMKSIRAYDAVMNPAPDIEA